MNTLTTQRALACAAIASSLLIPLPLHAQKPPQRLSDWLLEQPASPDAYPLGLSWRVPEETAHQTTLYLQLLRDLSRSASGVAAAPEGVLRLRDWVSTLPVTGRVQVAIADARWLQANTARDPVLRAGHQVVLPKRPATVTVVTPTGERCQPVHVPGWESLDYLKSCMPDVAGSVDLAWMAQPDGRVQRFGIASWNREEQDEPAPGAWIWAPPRDGGWPEEVSHRLISFLATQGPAADDPAARSAALRTSSRPQGATFLGRSRPPGITASDWGSVGVLQTPSARMAKTGEFSFSFSHTSPYSRGNIFFQPFDWLETGFRYVDISNIAFGPAELSGDQSAKDKSIDIKFRLWKESAYLPEIAVGLRDIAGTGRFSGEYVVGSKRAGNFDWSLGLGWGTVGGRGDLRNPLSRLDPSFATRKAGTVEGGSLSFGSYFRGPTALFGGVQYQTPFKPLLLKLEYDGNDYQHEGNNLPQSSPFNFGIVYRAGRSFDISLGFERGNRLMFGVAFHTQLDGMETPKPNDPPRIPVSSARPTGRPDWSATSRDIATQTEWHVRRIEQSGRELQVTVDDAEAVYLRDRVDKAAAVLHRDAPASVDRFALSYRQRGLDVAEHVIDRDTWARQQTEPVPPHERRPTVIPRTPGSRPAAEGATLYENTRPAFEHGLGMDYQQSIGGPDGFVLFQVSAVERIRFRLRHDTWLQGTIRLGLINNYDKFKFTAPSQLPRVRTLMREYLTKSIITMPNLQATHVGKLSENQFYSVYGGYLESMFGGVGAEWLYKKSGSRFAFGVDVNAVRQRDFEQDFGFRDYKVATGHATLYWDTGWQDVQARLFVGRYLAGDFGATLDLSRVFRNGVTIGAFATKTNVSAAQFGEGSFDKGIYLSIPFDSMLTRSTNAMANFLWKPLTRDGGAMLARTNQLHALTSSRNERALWYEPAPRPNEYLMPADRREEWEPKPSGPVPTLQVVPRPATGQLSPGSSQEHRLVEELYRQGFRDIKVSYDAAKRISLSLANDSLRPISRAIGRAARTALRLSPLDAREMRITFAERVHPLVVYEFIDLQRLDRFFAGTLSSAELVATVTIEYLDPGAREADPLAFLGDTDTTETQPKLSELVPGYRSVGRVGRDLAAAGKTATQFNWLQAGAIGAGLVLASSRLDKRAYKFSQDHANSPWLKGFNKVGNVLPWLGAGLVTIAALDGSDPRRSSTGFAALESAGVAFLASTGMKYMAGRARPESGLGPNSFKPGSSQDSFPSRHAIMAWAVMTPFALEYDSPWRYGAAAIASLARVTRREHWVSDVVAGSLLGYGIGRIFWESSRAQGKGGPRAMLDPTGISLAWDLD